MISLFKKQKPMRKEDIKTFADQVIYLLESEPTSWKIRGDFTIDHESDLSIWVSNGKHFVKSSQNPKRDFDWLEKRRIWRAFKEWQKHKVEGLT